MTSKEYNEDYICGFYSDSIEESIYSSSNSKNNIGKCDYINGSLPKISCDVRIDHTNSSRKINRHLKKLPLKKENKKKLSLQSVYGEVGLNQESNVQLFEDICQSLCDKKGYQNIKRKKKTQESKYGYPGETKNMYYNISQNLKHYIEFNFDEQQKSEHEIRKFLETPARLGFAGLKKILNQNSKLKQIARIFFAQFGWSRFFIMNNRVDLDPYFRFKSTFLIGR
ncbi:unnamed protein product [Paramecium pentaurelia]|uniref:Uncharacterized protein n=1 Tax=Paramecium pentaurelia TaxID=43138 RepID=A0A8S1VAV9_9CILI|nr:unnamed protein product [Paramecium pentaurelia]